MLPDKKG
ncbi:hypothetical protein L195_g062652, partial [Trifolium pratense]